MADPPTREGGIGGDLNKKIAGLPTWGWIALATAAGIAVAVYLQYRKKPAESTTTTQPSDGTDSINAQYASDINQQLLATIRDLQGDPSAPPTTTPTSTLAAPQNVKFTLVTRSSATVTWSPVEGADGYRVYTQNKHGVGGPFRPFGPMFTYSGYTSVKGDTLSVKVAAVKGSETSPYTVVTTVIK